MKILNTRTFATLFLSAAMVACTVGDTTQGRPTGGADAGAAADPDAGVATLEWAPATADMPLLKAAMHYVSDTEIYAVVDDKIAMWNGTAWVDHSLPVAGLAAAMHFVAPNQIYAIVGNKVCMWNGTAWVEMTLDMAGINDGVGNGEIHWVSDAEIYAVVKNPANLLDRYVAMYNGTAWVPMTDVAATLEYSMDFKSPTEIYAVLGTQICKWTGILGQGGTWTPISLEQVGLRPGIQVISDTEMYAVVGEQICKWDGLAWAVLTDEVLGLVPEFHRTSDEDILAVAGLAITHWAPVLP